MVCEALDSSFDASRIGLLAMPIRSSHRTKYWMANLKRGGGAKKEEEAAAENDWSRRVGGYDFLAKADEIKKKTRRESKCNQKIISSASRVANEPSMKKVRANDWKN